MLGSKLPSEVRNTKVYPGDSCRFMHSGHECNVAPIINILSIYFITFYIILPHKEQNLCTIVLLIFIKDLSMSQRSSFHADQILASIHSQTTVTTVY